MINGEGDHIISKKKNSCTKKLLFCACGVLILLILFIIVGGYFGFTFPYDNNDEYIDEEESGICLNDECLKAQVEIKSFIDTSVDPCENFHQFSCGNFLKNSYKEHFSGIITQEQERVKNELNYFILEDPHDVDSSAVSLQKQFFQSCLDVDRIDKDDNQSLLKLIDRIGGWPVVKGREWNEKYFNWTEVMMKARHFGLPFEWFLTLGVHYRENATNILKISFTRDCEIIMSDSSLTVPDVAVALSLPKLRSVVELNQVVNFSKSLKAICVDNAESEMLITTLGDLQKSFPKYNWLHLISNLTGIALDFDTEIATDILTYMQHLDQLLVRTSKRVQANFIVWKIIEEFIPFLSAPIRNITDFESSRVSVCLEETNKKFPLVSKTEFIRKYASKEVKTDVEDIVQNYIIEQIKEEVTNAAWILPEHRKIYLKVLESIEIEVGGPKEIFHEEFDQDYLFLDSLQFTSSNIIDMSTEVAKAYYRSIFKLIGKETFNPEKVTFWINPSYDIEQNRFTISAATLSGFLYNLERPMYLKFGGMGIPVIEELLEALRENIETDAIESVGINCFLHNGYEISSYQGLIENESLPLKDIYIHILAQDISFKAYRKWADANNGTEQQLLNLDYSPEELFWIKPAILTCLGKFVDSPDKEAIIEDSAVEIEKIHILSLQNSKYFNLVFHCEKNAYMNSKVKCSWIQ